MLLRKKTARQRLGEAGLGSLMRDARYFDGHHAEHRSMVNLVRRGFALVFDDEGGEAADAPARPGRTLLTQRRRRRRPFAEAVRRLAADEAGLDALPEGTRERLGRRAVLAALGADGAPFPSGFEGEMAEITGRWRKAILRSQAGDETPPSHPEDPGPKPKSEPERPQNPHEDRKGSEHGSDECAKLKANMDALKQEHQAFTTRIHEIDGRLQALRDERAHRMPSMQDKGPTKDKLFIPDLDQMEQDTPEAQKKRRGRAPGAGFGIDQWMDIREKEKSRQSAAHRRHMRAEEIEREIVALAKEKTIFETQREKVNNQFIQAELDYDICRMNSKLRKRK